MSPAESAGFRHFHDQLGTLKQRLLTMSQKAEALVELAVDALLTRDAAKAEAVIAGDREVDDLEIEIEKLALELLALQQPMARDLRFIIGAIKVTSDLERVGDHGVNVAQAALRMLSYNTAITPSIELLLVGRNLERVADLATNIGEDAVYLAEGKQIKHHFEGRSERAAG